MTEMARSRPRARRAWHAAIAAALIGALATATWFIAGSTYATAYDRAYADTPHEVEHVGVAPPPQATFEDHLAAALRSAEMTQPEDIAIIQHALRRAGFEPPDGPYGVLDNRTLSAIEAVLVSAPHQDAVASPQDVAAHLTAAQAVFFESIADQISPRSERSETHQLIAPSDARAAMWTPWRDLLGRAPSDAEVSAFVEHFNAQSEANPSVTVTELVPALDEDGLPVFVDGEQQFASAESTTSGGITVEAAIEAHLRSSTALQREADAYTAARYSDAFMCAIRSPLDPC